MSKKLEELIDKNKKTANWMKMMRSTKYKSRFVNCLIKLKLMRERRR
jgi:hypothetical protein